MRIFINIILIFSLFFIKKTFSQSTFFIVKKIDIEGNKVTKSNVILSELNFQINDTINAENLKKIIPENEKNLKKLSLFNFISFDVKEKKQNIFITIKVEERWYLWGTADLKYADRNFNAWLEKKDYHRINYGLGVSKYNFRGRNEVLKLKFLLGFTEEIFIHYRNLFLDKKRKHSLGANFSFLRTNQRNYTTINHKQISFQSEDEYILRSICPQINYAYRPNLKKQHHFYFSYKKITISDTLRKLNNNFLLDNKTKTAYFLLSYKLSFDYRDSKIYALEAYYFSIALNNKYFYQEKLDLIYLESKLNFHYKFNKKIFSGFGLKIKKNLGAKESFYFQKALGYNDNLRGFEYYVIDGEDFALLKTNLKFEILPQKTIHFKLVPLKKFNKIHYASYFNIHLDLAYVHNNLANNYNGNHLNNKLLYTYGFGLDLVTYYDKIIRLEYSFNSLKENGFFIHFTSAIK